MDIADKIFKNKRYKKIVDQLSNETLKIVANNRLRALKEAQRGIAKEEPEKVDDMEYLEAQADVMQNFAKSLLEKRSKSKTSKPI